MTGVVGGAYRTELIDHNPPEQLLFPGVSLRKKNANHDPSLVWREQQLLLAGALTDAVLASARANCDALGGVKSPRWDRLRPSHS